MSLCKSCHPRWLILGFILVLFLAWWQFVVNQRKIIYFNSHGQVVKQESEAYFIRRFRIKGDFALVQDFYFPSNIKYSDIYEEPLDFISQNLPKIESGEYTLWYKNGQKKLQGHFSNKKPNGLWQAWYENGRNAAQIYYNDGVPDGEFTTWYRNGTKSAQLLFRQGKAQGYWRQWYANGQLKNEIRLNNGDVKAISSWDNKGNLLTDLTVQENNTQNGVVLEWYPSGAKKSESVFSQDKLVRRIDWSEDGSISSFE